VRLGRRFERDEQRLPLLISELGAALTAPRTPDNGSAPAAPVVGPPGGHQLRLEERQHCTLVMGATPGAASEAVRVCLGAGLPTRARFEQVALVEFRPVKVIFAFDLAGA